MVLGLKRTSQAAWLGVQDLGKLQVLPYLYQHVCAGMESVAV
jgi:hypothetical protein